MAMMREGSLRSVSNRIVRVLFGMGFVAGLLSSLGCKGEKAEAKVEAPPSAPVVKTAHPERMTFHRVIEQPAWVEAYEVTAIYPKISGFVEDVHLDIGDRVEANELLAKLRVPELVEEHKQKKEQVQLAKKLLSVAQARIATAKAQVHKAEAALGRYVATRDYWRGQSERFTRLGQGSSVVDKQSVEEAVRQYRSAAAGVQEAEAEIELAKANLLEMEATRDKAQADINVAEADERRVAALLTYTEIRAPFKGVISHRYVHTGHFLQPGVAGNTGKAEPLYEMLRMDRVRVFLDVPEADAILVHDGDDATIRIPVLNNREFRGKVAGSAWSLTPLQRTLRTEIDFDNPDEVLRPNMYAHASIPITQPNALSLPSSAVLIRDSRSFCYRVEDGKAVRTIIRIGAREGDRIEVLKKQGKRKQSGAVDWDDFSGKENIIVSKIDELRDGQTVQVKQE